MKPASINLELYGVQNMESGKQIGYYVSMIGVSAMMLKHRAG